MAACSAVGSRTGSDSATGSVPAIKPVSASGFASSSWSSAAGRPSSSISYGSGTFAAYSGFAIPARHDRLRVDRHAVDVDLGGGVAADRAGVAGLADLADPLPRPHPLPLVHARRLLHVRVHVGPMFSLAVDQ